MRTSAIAILAIACGMAPEAGATFSIVARDPATGRCARTPNSRR